MTDEQTRAPGSLGKRIAHARRVLGVRDGRDVLVPDLAKRVGVTAASLYNWEADEAVPGEVNLERLAQVLGVTPAYLRYGVGSVGLPSAPIFQPSPLDRPISQEEIARARAARDADRAAKSAASKTPGRRRGGAA